MAPNEELKISLYGRTITVSNGRMRFCSFDKVLFTVYASFELAPMLGNGEALYTSETHVEELVGGTSLITFSPGELGTAAPDPSLLITLGRWYSNHPAVAPSGDDSNQLDSEESLVLVRETDLGQEALLRYHNEYRTEDLENAVQHFECAWHECPLTHPCRAVVLVNLAKAKFISYQIDPTSANLDESIRLYRQALDLRRPGRPDRPATLLQLAQTLLFRYEKQGCNEPIADEIDALMTEPQDFPEDSHERRAADLVLETLRRCRVINSGSSAELDELVRKLKHSATVPPDRYFDRPQRLINLGTALWRRYEKHGKLSDLDHSLEMNKQALQLLPGPKYGEGTEYAVGRLLEQIITRSGDVVVLDWIGNPGAYNSCLPGNLRPYSATQCHVPSPVGDIPAYFPELDTGAILLYKRLVALESPQMTDGQLHLPCITFRVELHVVEAGVYRMKMRGIRDVEIRTMDDLSTMSQNLVLVHPWIRALLGPSTRPTYIETREDEIDALMTEPQDFPEDSHERRAADLVLETLRRCRVINSGSSAELDELVRKLKHSATVPPDRYFDRPQRLINLGTALWRRYEKHGKLSDLDHSLEMNKQALQLLPGRHHDRISCLRTLSAALWRLFEIRGDLCDLEKLIAMAEEALQLIPEGHPERPYWVNNSTSHLAEMSERLGDTAFEAQKYDEAIAQYSQAIGSETLNYAGAWGLRANHLEPHYISANRDEGPSSLAFLASERNQGDASDPFTNRLAGLYIKRSKAAEEMHQWDLALEDANRAIELDPWSPLAYERKEAVQYAKTEYDRSILRTRADKKDAIRESIREAIKGWPPMLINTQTGRGCNRQQQELAFEDLSPFKEYLSS
ncbi:hypothetical protein PAXINDRAFT_181783, partial [Paxillus involutus ATCC 200175]